MNHHIEDQPPSPGSEHHPVAGLENPEPATITVIGVPVPAPCVGNAAPGGRTRVLVASNADEDLANATWEDAEWQ